MNFLKIFDYLTITAMIFLSYGVFKQWSHIYKTKSAKDIVTQEVILRFIATLVILIKIILINDIYLITGQFLFSTVMAIYVVTLISLKSKY